jgi:hypothetical protein
MTHQVSTLIVAGVVPRDGQHYVSLDTIKDSDAITFLW